MIFESEVRTLVLSSHRSVGHQNCHGLETCSLHCWTLELRHQLYVLVHRGIRLGSAVHRSRSFAGAGAGVCSPPAKLRQHLFVLQTSIIDQRKTNFIDEKVNTA